MVSKGELLYSGKAKKVYRTDSDELYWIEFTDNISAFDGGKKDVLSGKGYFNAQISQRLFTMLEENGISTHYVEMASDTEMIVRSCEIIPLEIITRNIAAGSITRNYPFKEGEKLEPTIVVMDLKDDNFHDPMINQDIALALDLCSSREWDMARCIALDVNRLLFTYFEKLGLLMPDLKIEVGRPSGKKNHLILADELSPDSMRLWRVSDGQVLDKDVYRKDIGDVIESYKEVAKLVAPELFVEESD
jgi:phosphoribosylaminoimidazole-succinocarboxamide synthase